jgi:hemin uptake protein HemP
MTSRKDRDDPSQDNEGERSSGGEARHVMIKNDQLDSRELFVGTRAITILHGSEAYHLRLTAQNKLILTK